MHYDAMTVREYIDKYTGEVKKSYTRLGKAFPFRERPGYTVRLDAMPAAKDGQYTILLFEPRERDQDHSEQARKEDRREETPSNPDVPF